MSESDNKKLSDLKVVELRSELEKRGLDSKGVKQVLHDRLAKALKDDGKDPDTYVFDVNEKSSDEKTDDKEPEKAAEEEKADDTAKSEKEDTDAVVDGHESPIRLTLEDDEAIQEVENEEKVTDEDKKNDEGTPVPEKKEGESAEKSSEQAKEEDGSSKPGDNKLQKKVAKANPNVLWISNIAKNTRASELKTALSAHGKVVGAKVVVNARFPGSSCFGYVTMGSVEDVENVISKLNNTELNGQIIKIDKFDLVRAEQMKNMSSGKPGAKNDDKKDEKTEGKDADKSEHKSRGRTRHDSSSRKSDGRAKSASSKGRKGSGDRSSHSGRRERDVLTFEKIRAERERQRLREKERQLRTEEARRRQDEEMRRREAERRHRLERERLEREKEKLKLERERIEREKAELVRMERERQKLEREKIAREKMQLERTLMRLGEERKASKRPAPYHESYDDRKRSATDRHYDAPPPPSISSRPGSGAVGGGGSRMYERDSRGSRPEMPSRGAKEGRYERERSPHFRHAPSSREDRRPPIQESKLSLSMAERLGRYETSEPNARYDRNMSWQSRPPQNSSAGSGMSMSQKSWPPKDQWRQEPVVPDRWQTSQAPSRPYSGVSNSSGNLCPPPPGITSYPDSRFNSGMRKY